MSINTGPGGPGTFPPGFNAPNYQSPHRYFSEGPNAIQYTIQAGDQIWELAARYHTTVGAIIAANPGLDPNHLYIGQVIIIPNPQYRVASVLPWR